MISPYAYAGSPALPTGGRYAAGAGHIGMSGPGTLTIDQSTTRGIINWQGFSIGTGGKVQINNGTGATLNRVTGGNLSQIDGALSGTGSIYLINPNGVVVGPGGKVLTGGSFVASTRDEPNATFMKGGAQNFAGASPGTVTNEGSIIAKDGDVVMIGESAANMGTVSAPHGTATLAAGNKVLLATVNGPAGVYVAEDSSAKGDVTNAGSITAAAAALKSAGGNVYALAGNRGGMIQATGTTMINGQVWLSAPKGTVSISGDVSARNADGSGGTVIADGGQVTVENTARITATGRRGGKILIGVAAPGGVNEAQETRIASGAKLKVGGLKGGGHIETSGKSLSLGKASISAGQGGSWLVDPTDLTIDSTAASTIDSSLNSGTSVTEQTTASGASGSGTQSSGFGDININAPISWTNAAASLNILAYHAININASITGKGGVLMSAGGDLTIASGVSVVGDAGVTLGTAANFINNAGSAAVSAGTSGRWLIYSTNPANDTDGGLTPNFLQYAASFPASGSGAAIPAQSTGNGFLYSAAPSLTVSLTSTVTKTYDGTNTAPLTSGNYSASGLINGDTGVVAAIFGTANAGSNIAVKQSGFTAYHGSSAIPVYGYSIANPGVTANIGIINPALITTAIIGNPTKIYDGTTTATLTAANYSVSGFVAGESATVTQPSAVAYAAGNAGPQTVNASLIRTDFSPGTGTNLSNYQFAASATGAGTIDQAGLEITGVLATGKTYDRTTSDALNVSSAGLYGIIGSDAVTLSTAGATGTFASPDAGSGLAVTASGFTLSGAQASDYRLIEPAGLTANISQAPLMILGVATTNKIYDGTNADTLSTSGDSLSGVISGDTIALSNATATGSFASDNVGNGIAITASGFSISGAVAGNYSFAQPSGLTANIIPAPLTVSIAGDPTKTYNGTATAVVSPADYTIAGLVTGQDATIQQSASAQYASANAGPQTLTVTLTAPDFMPAAGTALSNYSLPGTVTGTGTISPAPIAASIQSNPEKVYDGTAAATLGGSNYVLTGFVAGQGVTIGQTAGTYDSANAGVRIVSANVGGAYTADSGTVLSNYSLPTIISGYGTITPAPLHGDILATIINDPTKPYDGTTTATLTAADYSLAGFVSGQGATVDQTTGQYATPNVGMQPVTATLAPSNFTPDNSSTNLSNYTLPTTAYGTGTINPAILTASIVNNPTKIYDGTTTGIAGPSDYTFSGFAAGQGVRINQSALLNYGTPSAGSQSVTATLATTDFTANSGTALTNYVLPATASGIGTILPADLHITGVGATNKIYDTTTADALGTAAAALSSVVNPGSVTLSIQNATGTFASASAGSGIVVTVAGFAISGSDAADYQLIQPTGLAANITPAPLNISGVTASNKAYDSTNADTLATAGDALTGVLGSDSVTLSNTNASGMFGSVNIGTGLAVAASGFSIWGAQAADYALNQPGNLTANITPALLTALVIGNPTKTYDATASTTLRAANYDILGFVAGQGASLPQTAAAGYASANAGTEAITANLVSSDFVAAPGTNLSNYTLPTTGTGNGTINQAPVTAQIIGNPTKNYDATTNATLTQTNFSLFGLLAGQSASVTETFGTYGAASAGAEPVTATLAASDFVPGSGTLLANYALPITASGPGTINRALLDITGVAATDKIYNATTNDILNVSNAAVSGLLGSDTVNLSSTGAAGTFASPDVGSGIQVSANGFTISGGESADYMLAQPSGLAANITQASLNLASVTKIYDSTTGLPSSGTAYTLAGIYGSDSVSLNPSGLTGSYAAKNVGHGLSVSVSGLSITGASAGNYIISSSVSNDPIGMITPAPLGISGVTADNKVYDNTTAATLTNTNVALTGEYSGDVVTLSSAGTSGTFTSPNAGTNIPVIASGYTISGADAGNYSLSQPSSLTATITPDPSLTLASVSKTYNSTTGLPTGDSQYVISGILGSNAVSVNPSGVSGSYASSNVNTGIDVSIVGITLNGPQAEDYSIASSVTADPIGNINQAPLSVAIINNPAKTYDGTTTATLTSSNYSLIGFQGGQNATIDQTTGSYLSAAAGSENVTAALTFSNFAPAVGTALSNYLLPGSATGLGIINKAGLTIAGVGATNKVYNHNTADTLSIGGASLSGVVAGDTVNLSTSSATGTFASADVGNGIGVTAGGFAISGAQAGDYIFTQPTGLSANITPATLALSAVTKLYDSTTFLPASSTAYTLSGIYGGDTIYLNMTGMTGSFAAKNKGTGLSVTAAGLSLSGAQSGDYQITSSVTADPIGIITPANLIVVGMAAANKIYDGTTTDILNNAAASLQGVLGADTVTLGMAATGTFATSNAQSGITVTATGYTISGADAANYNLTEPSGLSAAITPKSLSVSLIGDPSKTYDGTTGATLAPGNFALSGFVSGQGASIGQTSGSYNAATVAGASSVTAALTPGDFTANGGTNLANYALPGSASGAGTITPATLTYNASPASRAYGTANPALSGSVTGFVAGETMANATTGSLGFATAANTASDVGQYAITGNGLAADQGDYIFTQAVGNATALTIDQALLAASIIGDPSKTYDGTTGATLAPGNFALSGFVSGQGASIGQTSGSYNAATVAGASSVTAALTPGDFTANGGTNLANYALPGSASGAGTITPATLTYNASPASRAYGTANPALSGSVTGFVAGETMANATTGSLGFATAANTASDVGQYAITGNGLAADQGDYIFTQAVGNATALTIDQALLAASIIGDPSKTYDGTTGATLAPGNFALSGFVSGQGASIGQTSGSYNAATVAGASSVTAALTPGDFTANGGTNLANYALPGSASGAGTITPATLTYNASPASRAYGTANPALSGSVTGFVAGETMANATTGSLGFATAANTASDVGQYAITGNGLAADQGDYIFTQAVGNATALTIDQALLAASIIGDPSKTYDGTTGATLAPGNFALSGFVSGQGASIGQTSGSYNAATVAGASSVTAALTPGDFTANGGTNLANYALPGSASGAGTITPATLTYNASPASRAYGTANPALSGSVTGFVAGETMANATTGSLGFATAANTASDVGQYAITGNGLAADQGDYIFTQAVGNATALTIDQALLAASIIGDPSKTYDGTTGATLAPGNFALSGFVSGQGASIGQTSGSYNAATVAGASSVTAALTPGDFTANGGTSLANYALPGSASGAGTITPATLTYNASPASRAYGTANPALSGSVTGFVAGETMANATTGSLGFATAANTASDVGQYAITGNGLAADQGDYIFTQAVGNATALTIDQALLAASIIGDPSKTYDGTTGATLAPGNFALSGFVSGQGASIGQTSGSYNAATVAGASSVTAALTPGDFTANGGTSLANYALPGSASGAGTITPATLTYNASPASRAYGTANPALSGSVTGFVAGETMANATTGSLGFATAANTASDVGQYAITGNGLAADQGDYIFTQAVGNATALTIDQALLAASIIGDPSKTYDGTTGATLAPGNFALSGFVSGQGASIGQTSGSYNAATVAGASSVTAALTPGDFTANGGTSLANYALPGSASGAGTITPATLIVAITDTPTKIYNGTTTAALMPGEFTLYGFVFGQGAIVTQTSGTYGSANAGAESVAVTLAGSDFTADSGTSLSNYALPSSASGTGQINQAILKVVGVNATSKLFDGNRTDKLVTSDAALRGLAGTGTVELSTTDATGRFASASVGNNIGVTASGFTISGPAAVNYQLVQPLGLTANIAPSTLMAAIIGNLPNDGGMSAASQGTVTSAIAGVTPVINIPFPAPSGLSTRGGNIFGSLPVIVSGHAKAEAVSSGTDTLSSNQPLIVNPEEILLQGIKDKVWHITLPSSANLTTTSKLHS